MARMDTVTDDGVLGDAGLGEAGVVEAEDPPLQLDVATATARIAMVRRAVCCMPWRSQTTYHRQRPLLCAKCMGVATDYVSGLRSARAS